VAVRWFPCTNYKEQVVLGAKAASKLDQVLEWLRQALQKKPLYAHEVQTEAHARGYAWRTVEQAKALLRVKSVRKPWHGPGPGSTSLWSLP
jgi:hypothetical protein